MNPSIALIQKQKSKDKPADNPTEHKHNNKKNIGQFILGDKIGEGTFGVVRLGTHLLTGEKVAIKILEKVKILEQADKTRVEREIKILKCLRHNNIIQLYSVNHTVSSIYLIMEYASGKELFDYIVLKKRLKENEACRFFQQLISGIEYLHKLRIVHRDLKPENLLLDSKNNMKIVDFGLSNLYNKGELLSTACGSPSYAAPEMINGSKYKGVLVDIWSCGIILYAMICGFLPFEDKDNEILYKKITEGIFTFPKWVSDPAKDIIKCILTPEPTQRYTISQIKSHPWYQLVNPQLNMNEGLLINYNVIPIDEGIVSSMLDYGFKKEDIQINILSNRHNHITTTYYLLLKIKTKKGQSSVSDLVSEEFNAFIQDPKNLFSNYNYNFLFVINERVKSQQNASITEQAKNTNDYLLNKHDKQIESLKLDLSKTYLNDNTTQSGVNENNQNNIQRPLNFKKRTTALSTENIKKQMNTSNDIPKGLNSVNTIPNKKSSDQVENKVIVSIKKKMNCTVEGDDKDIPSSAKAIDYLHMKIKDDYNLLNKNKNRPLNENTNKTIQSFQAHSDDLDELMMNTARNPLNKLSLMNMNNTSFFSTSTEPINKKAFKGRIINNYIPYKINKMINRKRNKNNFFNTTMSFEKDPENKNANIESNPCDNTHSTKTKIKNIKEMILINENDKEKAENKHHQHKMLIFNNQMKNLSPNEANYLSKKSVNKRFEVIKEEEEDANSNNALFSNLSNKKNEEMDNNVQVPIKARNTYSNMINNHKQLEKKQRTIHNINLSQNDKDTGNVKETRVINKHNAYVDKSKVYSLKARHQKNVSNNFHNENQVKNKKKTKQKSRELNASLVNNPLSSNQTKTNYNKQAEVSTFKDSVNLKMNSKELNMHFGPIDLSCLSFKSLRHLKENILKVLASNKIRQKNTLVNI